MNEPIHEPPDDRALLEQIAHDERSAVQDIVRQARRLNDDELQELYEILSEERSVRI